MLPVLVCQHYEASRVGATDTDRTRTFAQGLRAKINFRAMWFGLYNPYRWPETALSECSRL